MGRKRASQSATTVSDELHARIARLSELIWSGNQSAMGRDLGVDQSAVSKVLAGKQQPSAMLIERLATWSRVNPAWLMSGRGEPLLDGSTTPGVGLYCPLVEEIPPGRLSELPAVRAGVSYPVAGAHYTPTSYWFKVPPNHPVTYGTDVTTRDLILIETDPQWTGSIGTVRDKMVVLSDPEESPGIRRMVIGAVDATEEPTFADYEMVSELYPIRLYTTPPARETKKTKRSLAWLVLPGTPKAVREAAAKLKEPVVTLDDLVGLRMCLLRPSW
jgi:transcriptional regulator with XRE-family HTH domain